MNTQDPSERAFLVEGVTIPRLVYGTAWKEDATRGLVEAALAAGFRGVDTANQRKHYHEAAVGEALRAAIAAGQVTREALFVQTKYTFRGGQDDRLPYDPAAPIPAQVAQSHASSCAHLGVERVDAYLLHGPSQREGLGPLDRQAWRAMEALHAAGGARLLGVSNVSVAQLELLCDLARVPPAVVQNRCYANRGWDADVRRVCRERGVVYQGFSLLTANEWLWRSDLVGRIAASHGRTSAQVVLRYALDLGMVALTGTTRGDHMRDDLAILDFALTPDDAQAITALSASPRRPPPRS